MIRSIRNKQVAKPKRVFSGISVDGTFIYNNRLFIKTMAGKMGTTDFNAFCFNDNSFCKFGDNFEVGETVEVDIIYSPLIP